MVVDNIVDCVDFEKSNIIYYDNNRRCTYKRSECDCSLPSRTMLPISSAVAHINVSYTSLHWL